VVLSFLQALTLKDLTSVTSLLSLLGSTQVQAGRKLTLKHTALKHKTWRFNFIEDSNYISIDTMSDLILGCI
jgi:hypothetical protein